MSKKYKSDQIYLENILESCEKILEYSKTIDLETLQNRDLEFDAIVMRFQVIGEEISKLEKGPDRILNNFSDQVNWQGFKRLRDVISHNYQGLVESEILRFINESVAETRDAMKRILNQRYGVKK